jgi:hypothetical protein
MREVAVAFPTSEAAAEVIASKLRTEGIAARVDRGLLPAGQPAQIRVVVDESEADRARKIVGGPRRGSPGPG